MKKGMIKLLDVLAAIGVVLMGGWLVYTSLFNESLNTSMYDEVRNRPIFGAAVGLFLILSVFLRVASASKHRAKNSFIKFDSDDGSVGISTQAIQDFIERVGKEFAAIKSIESTLHKNKNSLDIAISVKVVSGNKIPELSQVLQQRVRESVRESLGLEEIGNITIQVQEIVGEPAKHVAEDTPPGE